MKGNIWNNFSSFRRAAIITYPALITNITTHYHQKQQQQHHPVICRQKKYCKKKQAYSTKIGSLQEF